MPSCPRVLFLVVFGLAPVYVHVPAFAQTPSLSPPSGSSTVGSQSARAPLSETLTGPAKAEYDAGRLLFSDRDYGGALIKFTRAYEASRDLRLLYNMAACEKNLRHYARAIHLLEQYRTEGAGRLLPADVREADELLGAFQPFVSHVQVSVSEAGATVYVDDTPIGQSPLGTDVLVDIGTHRFRVVKSGYREFATVSTIGGAGTLLVEARLERDVHEGEVRIQADAEDVIALDGAVVAKGRWEARVPAGAHALRVTADGMRPYQSDLYVEENKTRTLDITLEANPPSMTPTWLWIAGGVVLATGTVVAITAVFRPADPLRTGPTPGTAQPGTVQLSWLPRW